MNERAHFSDTQRDILLQPIADWRVQELDGQSHLAGWDVIAHLNRLFGFEGWDKEIVDLALVYEHVGNREVRRNGETKTVPACSVGYRCTLRLTIRNAEGAVVRIIDDTAMGTATNQRDIGDAHDLAIKSAVTYALKRCAKDLGDQFGLSLYNRGQRAACVGRVAVYGHDPAEHEGNVHADGISEGDEGFGHNRGEGEAAPPAEPEAQPAEAPPVREPEPARPKADKPEATPPAEKPTAPELDDAEGKELVAKIIAADSIDAVKEVWKGVQDKGQLDSLVLDLKTEKQATLRELMVRRVKEIEVAA